jgi:hypothetical protein
VLSKSIGGLDFWPGSFNDLLIASQNHSDGGVKVV